MIEEELQKGTLHMSFCRKMSLKDRSEYLLTEIPKHLDDTGRNFPDDMLPWSPNLPANCLKLGKDEMK